MNSASTSHTATLSPGAGKIGATERWLALFAALNGFVAVALGAFAAHAARRWLDPPAIELLRTGALYEMFHALAMLAGVGVAPRLPRPRILLGSQIAFAMGIVLFSGSLYLLAFTGQSLWGAVTPLGGVAFLVGWLLMAWGFWRYENT